MQKVSIIDSSFSGCRILAHSVMIFFLYPLVATGFGFRYATLSGLYDLMLVGSGKKLIHKRMAMRGFDFGHAF